LTTDRSTSHGKMTVVGADARRVVGVPERLGLLFLGMLAERHADQGVEQVLLGLGQGLAVLAQLAQEPLDLAVAGSLLRAGHGAPPRP
jgi:hypothetical protein